VRDDASSAKSGAPFGDDHDEMRRARHKIPPIARHPSNISRTLPARQHLSSRTAVRDLLV
jgi:hypothetical protein